MHFQPKTPSGLSVTATNSGGNTTATIRIAVTSDRSSWTSRTLPSSSDWQAFAFGNGVFVAIALGFTTAAATSTDGITWTSRTLPSSGGAVTFGNGVFLIISPFSNIEITSPDGITWTNRTLPSASNWQAVGYGNGVFVALSNTTIAASSP